MGESVPHSALESQLNHQGVAKLLGNTEEKARKLCAAWIPERLASLQRSPKEAFEDKPMPKLLVKEDGRFKK